MQGILLYIGYFERRLSNCLKKLILFFFWTACHLHVTHMYLYVMHMSLVCTRMSFVYHSYVIRMSLLCIRMSFVCTRMSFVLRSYVLVCHLYVTRMYSYVIRMSLVCGFAINCWWMKNSPKNIKENREMEAKKVRFSFFSPINTIWLE